MRNRLLLLVLSVCTCVGAFALELNDYVFTSSARYKIMGENICVNGTFDGLNGWNAVSDTITVDQSFSVETDPAITGHTIKSIVGADVAYGCYQRFATEASTAYIVTFKVRNTNGGFTSNIIGGNYNFISAYFNTTGLPNDSTNLVSCGTNIGVSTEWQTVSFAYVDTTATGQSGYLFFKIAGVASNTEFAEVEVRKAIEVYDTRKAIKVINYAEMLLSKDFFTEMRGDLQEELDATKDMYLNDNDAMGEQVASLQSIIDMFIDENTEDYYAILYGDATTKNNGSPNWNQWTVSYNRGGLTSLNGWTFVGGNWGNRADLDGDGTPDQVTGRPVWSGSLGYGQSYPDESTAYCTLSLPDGKWMTQIQSQGGHMSGYGSQGLQYVINPTDTCMNLQIFVGNDSTEKFRIAPTEYNLYTKFFELTEAKNIVLGYKITLDSRLSGVIYGGNVDLYYPVLRRVKGTSKGWSITENKWISDANTQIAALNTQLTTASTYLGYTDRPWGKKELQTAYDTYKPMYDKWAAMTEAEIVEKGEGYADTIYNTAVRLQRVANEAFVTENAPVVALKPYLDDAKTTIADPANAKADKVTYQKAIDEAQGVYDHCFTIVNQTSEDSAACYEQKEKLITAKLAFKASIANKDNPAELEIVNPKFAENNGGSKGSLTATGWDIISEESNGGWQIGYWWGHNSGDADANEHRMIGFNRGTTAYPINKASQTIKVTTPGYYTLTFKGYAYNCVESTDKLAAVYAMIWEPDWEEWVKSDSIADWLGAAAFIGLNGAPDSIHVHKNPKAEDLGGVSLYGDGKTQASTPFIYNCPPDYYQLTVKKETSEEETWEFGISFLDNFAYCDGGFGDPHIYFTGQDLPYNPVIGGQPSTKLAGDADEDGDVTVSDITTIAAYILGQNPSPFNKDNADTDGDGDITVSDITGTASIILGK